MEIGNFERDLEKINKYGLVLGKTRKVVYGRVRGYGQFLHRAGRHHPLFYYHPACHEFMTRNLIRSVLPVRKYREVHTQTRKFCSLPTLAHCQHELLFLQVLKLKHLTSRAFPFYIVSINIMDAANGDERTRIRRLHKKTKKFRLCRCTSR